MNRGIPIFACAKTWESGSKKSERGKKRKREAGMMREIGHE